jgi:hypothetical protein
MYKLSGVLNYGMTIKRFNIPDNLHVHLLCMFMHLNVFFRCTKEFLYVSSSYKFLLSVFVSRPDVGSKTEPKHVAKETE